MNRITNKPHLIFWISIPVIILIGILKQEEILGFNVHDTYFLFNTGDLAIVISILFSIIGLGYWIILKSNRKLSKWLNLIHISLTFGGISIIWILDQLFKNPIKNYDFNNNLTLVIYLIVLLTILGQVIFPVNIISAIIKKPNKTSGYL